MNAFAGVGLTGRQLWLAIAFVGAVSSALTAPVYLHFRGEVGRIEVACAERLDRVEVACAERLDRVDSERRALSEMALRKAELCAEQRLEHVAACAALRNMADSLLSGVGE